MSIYIKSTCISTAKTMKFCIMDFADLVTFNEEILNENFIFCAVFITHKKSNIYIYIKKISENLVNKKGLNAYMLMAVNITSYWLLYLLLKLVQNFISFFPPNSHGSRTIMKDQQCWLDNSAYSSVQNKLMIITTKYNLKNLDLIKRD